MFPSYFNFNINLFRCTISESINKFSNIIAIKKKEKQYLVI